jgi:hypothetical protein
MQCNKCFKGGGGGTAYKSLGNSAVEDNDTGMTTLVRWK